MNHNTLQEKLKHRLHVTWNIFFRRFGILTEIQLKSIPIVLQKKNAIITSSTATGKTEAVIAPISELLLEERWPALSILYITPTRALVNDIFERLESQLQTVGIKIEKKTGDSPYVNWSNPPDMLITTPESLDSMICRNKSVLQSIHVIILDELHILDGNYRGDQLRILLKRLRQIDPNFTLYILSATLSNPLEVGARYVDQFELIEAGGSRQIIHTLAGSLEEVFEKTRKEELKKILIFCNSRRRTEETAIQAKRLWGENFVVVHHGSLHKHEREESEFIMKTNSRAVCVATMTLEIGIDIGNIDAVVLVDVPFTISSLIQRIGRAGRRTGIIRIFGICSPDEREIFEVMIKAARENLLETKICHPDYSVCIQQLFSMSYATPQGILRQSVISLLGTIYSIDDLEKCIFPHLQDLEWIEVHGDKIYATEKLMNLGAIGKIHSNIPDTHAFSVKNVLSNRLIGEIELPVTIKPRTCFVLAGKVWEIVKVEKRTIQVKPSKTGGIPASFKKIQDCGAFFYLLPEIIQERESEIILNGDG